jgi:hypothetical protein
MRPVVAVATNIRDVPFNRVTTLRAEKASKFAQNR